MTQLRKMSKTKLIQTECKNIANQVSIFFASYGFFFVKSVQQYSAVIYSLQLYGKSCENVRGRLKATFCRSFWYYNRLQNEPGFKDVKIVTDDLVIAYQIPPEVTLNKPIQVASAILDHSKRYYYYYFYMQHFTFKY